MAAKTMEEIAAQIKKLRFRKKLVGGVDEADVWKQLEQLNRDYRSAFEAREAYYQALLDERNRMVAKLKRAAGEAGNEPGQVRVTKDRLLVETGNGVLSILELQLEGKKRMEAAAFLRGFSIETGRKFGRS